MTKILATASAVALAAVLGVTAWFVFSNQGGDRFAQCRESTVVGGSATVGGPFSLVRQDGARVTEEDVITGPTLVYFGYTYCPDVCPIDLARNAEVADLLEERGIEVTPVMITVDPDRDTPEVMADFLTYMHPRAIGLSGSSQEIEEAKATYRVYSAKRGEGEDYLVDHSTFTYLMAPGHGLLEFFRRDHGTEVMAERVACFAERI